MMVNLPCLKGSCPNFLRPTCSYTECRLSFLTGSCPTERTTASSSSCLYLILLAALLPKALVFCGCSALARPVGLVADAVLGALRRYRVSFQNPARLQNPLEPSKALEMLSYLPAFLMLPLLSPGPPALCPLSSFSDHTPFLWSGLYR